MENNLVVAIKANGARAGARTYNRAVDSMALRTTNVDRKVSGLTKRIGGLAAGFSALIAIRGAVKAMASFEETMVVVRGVTGATTEEFVELTETAKIMGATTRFSATQAGEGLLFLARAGFTVNESMAAISPTLQFAQANVLDLGQAADIVSNILTQFGKTAKETALATDILTLTANSSNTNILQLAEGMKFAGPIAGQLGITLEETSAAMGVLGNAGIQASLAGTGLRQIMLSLVAPTAKARKAIIGLGLDMKDLDPTTSSLVDIFKRLRDAELGAEEANAIFGRRAVGASLQIAQQVGELEKLTSELNIASGTVEKLAELMDDTLVTAGKNVASAFEAITLQAGDSGLLKVLKNVLNTTADAVRILLGMEEHLKGNTDAAKNLAASLLLIAGAFGVILAQKMTLFFGNMILLMTGMAASASTLAISLAAVVAVFLAFKLGQFLSEEFRVAQESAIKFLTFLQTMVENIKLAFGVVGETIQHSFAVIFEVITNQISQFLRTLGNQISSMEGIINKIPGIDITGSGADLVSVADAFQRRHETDSLANKIKPLLDERNKAVRDLVAIEDQVLKDIADEFGSKSRKGVLLSDKIGGQLKKVRDAILGAFVDTNAINLKPLLDAVNAGETKDVLPEVKEITGAMKILDDVSVDAGHSMARAFEDVIVGAKSASEAVKALIQDIARLVVRQAVTDPLAKGITAGLQSFAANAFSPATSGSQTSNLSGTSDFGLQLGNNGFETFTQTPRTAPQMSGGVELVVNNTTSTPVQASNVSTSFDAGKLVVQVLVEDSNGNGEIINSIRNNL